MGCALVTGADNRFNDIFSSVFAPDAYSKAAQFLAKEVSLAYQQALKDQRTREVKEIGQEYIRYAYAQMLPKDHPLHGKCMKRSAIVEHEKKMSQEEYDHFVNYRRVVDQFVEAANDIALSSQNAESGMLRFQLAAAMNALGAASIPAPKPVIVEDLITADMARHYYERDIIAPIRQYRATRSVVGLLTEVFAPKGVDLLEAVAEHDTRFVEGIDNINAFMSSWLAPDQMPKRLYRFDDLAFPKRNIDLLRRNLKAADMRRTVSFELGYIVQEMLKGVK